MFIVFLFSNPGYLCFSVLTFNPEMLPKISRVLNATCNDSILPSSINVVSSANCVILISTFPTEIPFIFFIVFDHNC